MTNDLHSKRGSISLDASEKRSHCVSTRLNTAELSKLDQLRGIYQRGEWMRMATLDKLPPTVPTLNTQAWQELARAAANLNQLARAMNAGEKIERGGVRDLLNEFRAALIGARLDDEGHEKN